MKRRAAAAASDAATLTNAGLNHLRSGSVPPHSPSEIRDCSHLIRSLSYSKLATWGTNILWFIMKFFRTERCEGTDSTMPILHLRYCSFLAYDLAQDGRIEFCTGNKTKTEGAHSCASCSPSLVTLSPATL